MNSDIVEWVVLFAVIILAVLAGFAFANATGLCG